MIFSGRGGVRVDIPKVRVDILVGSEQFILITLGVVVSASWDISTPHEDKITHNVM